MNRITRILGAIGGIVAAGLLSEYAWHSLRDHGPVGSQPDPSLPYLILGDGFDDQAVLGLINRLRARRGQHTILVLHTCGGDLSDVARLARAVDVHGNVEAWVPYRALSGGTVVALAAEKIVLWPDACLGPVDPQLLVGWTGYFSAHSLDEVVKTKGQDADDLWVATSHEGQRAVRDVQTLLERYDVPAQALPRLLNHGNTHGFPIFLDEAQALGLPVEPAPRELAAIESTDFSALLQGIERRLS
ncbi:MAG: SDH family Clp fold serine proteinase [Nannocystaceae bacterium]